MTSFKAKFGARGHERMFVDYSDGDRDLREGPRACTDEADRCQNSSAAGSASERADSLAMWAEGRYAAHSRSPTRTHGSSQLASVVEFASSERQALDASRPVGG